ncbi:MAG: NAD-dependent epimerase/dehydratase family protein [Actinomycetota bacterium]|nr:NAD-dependent epimerase/dehydratase family protein [Actinomycetota bacterium]
MAVSLVTGATGFVGGHVARLLAERGDEVRVTFRDEARLSRLEALDVEPVRADVLDRAALRRAMRGCDTVFHTAGFVGSRPPERLWRVNALAPRVIVEAAAAESVRRVVHTSTVAAIGNAPHGEVADETHVYRGGGFGLAYGESKHEGEVEALAAGARHGVEVVVVNPSYVLGVPVDPSQAGETSTRVIGNFLLGRLPAVVDGATNIVDVDDVAAGHLLAEERGAPGERYILGGYNLAWVELIDRLAVESGIERPLVVLPREMGTVAQVQGKLGLRWPIAPEAFALMAQNWRYSSRKAKRELGYKTRPLDATLKRTIEWYDELIASGSLDGRGVSPLSVAAVGMRIADRAGVISGLRAAERYLGRRLVTGR